MLEGRFGELERFCTGFLPPEMCTAATWSNLHTTLSAPGCTFHPRSRTAPAFMKLHGQTQRKFLTPKLLFVCFWLDGHWPGKGPLKGETVSFWKEHTSGHPDHPQLLASTKDVDADTRTNSRDLAHVGMLFSKLVKPLSDGSRRLNFYLGT